MLTLNEARCRQGHGSLRRHRLRFRVSAMPRFVATLRISGAGGRLHASAYLCLHVPEPFWAWRSISAPTHGPLFVSASPNSMKPLRWAGGGCRIECQGVEA